jgi:hypothetical protein
VAVPPAPPDRPRDLARGNAILAEVPEPVMVADIDIIATGLLAFVFLMVTFLSIAIDESRLFLVAGVIAFLLSFQAWTMTANIAVTLAVVVLGILMMTITIQKEYAEQG